MCALKLVKKGSATTSVKETTKKDGKAVEQPGAKETAESVDSPKQGKVETLAAEQVAMVECAFAYRKGLPNYSSMEFRVGISLPSPAEDVDEVFEYAKAWCDERLTKMLSEAENG